MTSHGEPEHDLRLEWGPVGAAAVRASSTGQELVEAGFATDVEIAVEIGSSAVVPVLVDGAFVDGR